jgi:hypothetical protein
MLCPAMHCVALCTIGRVSGGGGRIHSLRKSVPVPGLCFADGHIAVLSRLLRGRTHALCRTSFDSCVIYLTIYFGPTGEAGGRLLQSNIDIQ